MSDTLVSLLSAKFVGRQIFEWVIELPLQLDNKHQGFALKTNLESEP